jgi:hypothetical protein
MENETVKGRRQGTRLYNGERNSKREEARNKVV